MVRRLNVDGDGQGDRAGHGGEHRAVFVYQIEAYRYWQDQLGRTDFKYGQFGENFIVKGLSDDAVCVGDRYRIGSALFEVTQPRVTCYRVGIRMNEPQMAGLLVAHDRPGFYFRVLNEGEVEAGDESFLQGVSREHDRLRGERAPVQARPSGKAIGAGVAYSGASAGWRGSFPALLERAQSGGAMTRQSRARPGRPALRRPGRGSARCGYRGKNRESDNVTSLVLEPADGHPLRWPAGPVCRAAAAADTRARPAAAQLLAIGRAERA